MQPKAAPDNEPNGQRQRARERWWAVVRILVGQAQIIGATVAVYFLIQTGTSVPSLIALGVTALMFLVSKLLFRDRRD